MKKLISIFLGLLLIVGLMPMAVFAGADPSEYVPIDGMIRICDGGNYIISSGEYSIWLFDVADGSTLTIDRNAKVEVYDSFWNTSKSTINVFGTLIISGKTSCNEATIRVKHCGTMTGEICENRGTIIKGEHDYVDGICSLCGVKGCEIGDLDHTYTDGVCSVCGVKGCVIGDLDHTYTDGICSLCGVKGCEIGDLDHTYTDGVCSVCGDACGNEFHNGVYKCPTCGMTHYVVATGSTLSQGSVAIVAAISSAVIFGFSGFLLGRKKKPATVNSSEEE